MGDKAFKGKGQQGKNRGKKIIIKKSTPAEKILALAPPCSCDACKNGCRYGSGFLVGDDIKNIAKFKSISEKELKENFLEEKELFNTILLRPKLITKGKPYGKCIFFDEEKGCTVHPVKPLQCKISMGCKEYGEDLSLWFMLNHQVNPNDPESIRQYAIYLKTQRTLPGGSLKELVPDKEKLKNMLNFNKLK